jgi:hypothetical protein
MPPNSQLPATPVFIHKNGEINYQNSAKQVKRMWKLFLQLVLWMETEKLCNLPVALPAIEVPKIGTGL